MNKKIIIGIIIGILALASYGPPKFSKVIAGEQNNQNNQSNQSVETEQGYYSRLQVAEKIEVVHFHATQQCWSCITSANTSLKPSRKDSQRNIKTVSLSIKT